MPVGQARPPPGKEVRVQLRLDLAHRDRGGLSLLDPQQERVEDFAADELNEVRVAPRHPDDLPDRLPVQPQWTGGVFDRFPDGVHAFGLAQAFEEAHAKHPLGERASFDHLRKQRREPREDQQDRQALALEALERIEEEGERELGSVRVVGEVLRFVVGEDDAAGGVRCRDDLPGGPDDALELVHREAGGPVVDREQPLV